MLVSGVMVNAAYLRRQPDASRARAGRHRRYRSPQSVSSRPMTDSNKMTATDTIAVTLNVNGEQHALVIAPQRTLLDCLRYDLGLTGSKEGCGVGVCGACTVRIDGDVVSSCLQLAVLAEGRDIRTIEAVAEDGTLHPVQQAFIDNGGFQCGICTPGMVMSAIALLEEHPDPSDAAIREWMMGSLCRCTGYRGIQDSIKAAARLIQEREGRT